LIAFDVIQDYYQTLGIPLNASVEEVKKAYRRKAKELHPDLNPAADAKERFIELSKAYEFLLFYKSSGKEGTRPNPARTPQTPKPQNGAPHTHWNQKTHQSQAHQWEWNEAEAQKRAEAHARMKYKEYVNSPHYKETKAFETAVAQIFTLFAFAMLVVPGLLGLIVGGGRGLLIGLAVTAFSSPAWGGILREKHKINFRQLGEALLTLAKTNTFALIVGVPTHVILFFTFTDRAVVPTWIFPLSLLLCMGIAWMMQSWLRKRLPGLKRSFMLAAVAPAVVNLFFLLNYSFSSSPTSILDIRVSEHNPWMTLENGQYGSCALIRFFWDGTELYRRTSVRYEMETGLFGIKVMKGRKAI
jgi:hypothetical protein